MKLFIWEGDGVLSDYTSGMIVAIAPDLETALKKVEEDVGVGTRCYPASPSEIIDLQDPPTKTWHVWGGG